MRAWRSRSTASLTDDAIISHNPVEIAHATRAAVKSKCGFGTAVQFIRHPTQSTSTEPAKTPLGLAGKRGRRCSFANKRAAITAF